MCFAVASSSFVVFGGVFFMTWFLVDDGFFGHPKTSEASLEALGLWTLAGSWSGKYLTEGMIPKRQIEKLGGSQELAQELVRAGLWLDCNDYYQFYDWFGCNPHKEDVLAKRKQKEESGRKGGLASGRSRRSKSKQTRSKTRSKTEANAEAKPKQTRSENEPNTNTNTNTNTCTPYSPPEGGVSDDETECWQPSSEPTLQFDQLMAIYPNHDNPDDGLRELKRVLHRKSPHTSFAALLAGAQILANEHRDPRYVPTLGNWLRKGGWKNKPRPRAPVSSGPVPSRSQLNQDANAALIARYAQEEAQQAQEARKEIGS